MAVDEVKIQIILFSERKGYMRKIRSKNP